MILPDTSCFLNELLELPVANSPNHKASLSNKATQMDC